MAQEDCWGDGWRRMGLNGEGMWLVQEVRLVGIQFSNTRPAILRIPNTQAPGTQTHNTQTRNTQMHNTQIHNTQTRNTQMHNTQIHNTQMHNTRIPISRTASGSCWNSFTLHRNRMN